MTNYIKQFYKSALLGASGALWRMISTKDCVPSDLLMRLCECGPYSLKDWRYYGNEIGEMKTLAHQPFTASQSCKCARDMHCLL